MFKDKYEFVNVNMDKFYKEAFRINDYNGIPQILILKELENGKDILKYAFADGRSIICLKYKKNMMNMLKVLRTELEHQAGETMPADDKMYHSLANNNIGELITVCVLIAEMLEISCPQVEFKDNLESIGNLEAANNVISLKTAKNSEPINVLRAMFHELRCLWQVNNQASLNCEVEVDAEAFANKLFCAITGSKAEYATTDEEVKNKILAQEETIELNTDIVKLIKECMGYK